MRPTNIAARAGRWSAQHRRIAILGWFAYVVAATVGGGMIGTNSLAPAEMGNGSSKVADLAVDRAGFRESSGEQVLVQARSRDVSRAALQQAAADLAERLSKVPHVEKVVSAFDAGVAGQVSRDGRSALLSFEIAGGDDAAGERVDATLAAIEFKQMGVGLAAAILIDATIVRAVLLPATMKLLGDWKWYLPRGLAWLPQTGKVATQRA